MDHTNRANGEATQMPLKPIVIRTRNLREGLAMHNVSGVRTGRVALAMVLVLFLAPGLASADWPAFGRPISTAPQSQAHPAIATDGADGAIITWQDARSPRLNIFAQRVRASGELDAAWPVNGRALLRDSLAIAGAIGGQFAPVIVPDGAGGAIVAWQDLRSAVTEFDIYAQHILASGEVDPAWPANGRALCEIAENQDNQAIASDGAGGAIVTWMDARLGASVKDIYAQHVLASGVVDPRWPVDGLAVSTAPGLQEFPAIVEDGAGGAIITWDDARSSTSGLDVYAQHVLNSGVVDGAWPVDGRALCAADGAQGRGTITSDGAQGAIVAWTDGRLVNIFHIFAQHVLASGAVDPSWPLNGRAISSAAVLEGRPLAVPDGAGGAIVNWQGFTVQLNMYVQHVTATGVVDPAWPAGGRALSDSDRQQTNAGIVSDGAGGAVVAWQDSLDVVAQHVLASGALDPAYPDTGRVVCGLPGMQGEPVLVATAGSGAIVAWTDARNGAVSSLDIFALQVLAAGTLDAPRSMPPGIVFARPRPNPTRGSLTLRFALPRAAPVRLTIYDTTGRLVRELASGARPAGEQAIAWDLRDERGRSVRAGFYFARLEVEGRSLIQKLTALR
jgi:hypothetical protein